MKKQVYLFGAGCLGMSALAAIEKLYDVLGFVDNNSNKIGTLVENRIPIYSVSDLDLNNHAIIIVSLYYKEIYRQLKSLGAQNVEIYPTIRCGSISTESELLLNEVETSVCCLYEKLQKLNFEQLKLSKSFLRVYKEINYLLLYNYGQALFRICYANASLPSLLDCGGQGLLSLLALEFKIPLVYYYSNQQRDLADFKILYQALNIPFSDVRMGGRRELANFCSDNIVKFQAVCERRLYTDRSVTTNEKPPICKEFCDEENGIIYCICDRCILE